MFTYGIVFAGGGAVVIIVIIIIHSLCAIPHSVRYSPLMSWSKIS